jgi:hypothetical protein
MIPFKAPKVEKITKADIKAPPPNPIKVFAASAAIRVEDATLSKGKIYMYTAFMAI